MNGATELPSSPFRGIEPFRYADRAVFFARDEEVERLVRAIMVYRGVLLYGDSGCGKSSLINAGLLPRLLSASFAPHRLRVQPKPHAEILVERIAMTAEAGGPFLPSIFTDDAQNSERTVLGLEEFWKKIAAFRQPSLGERVAYALAAGTDPVTERLRGRIPSEVQAELVRCDPTRRLAEPLRMALDEALRRALLQTDLFPPELLKTVSLSERTQRLLQLLSADSEAAAPQRASLHQFVLEDAYPPPPPPSRQPLLIFDQFEEFVTLFEITPRGEARITAQTVQSALLDLIVSLLGDPALPVKILFVFREDYLAKMSRLFQRCPELPEQHVRLTPPAYGRLPDIIRGAFERFPGRFAREISAELSQRVTAAVAQEDGGAPVNLSEIEVACLELWESSDPDERFAQQGMRGLLEHYLARQINGLPESHRDAAIALLSRLVTSSGTRNIVSEPDLVEGVERDEGMRADLLRKALEALAETRLVRKELRREVFFYEIVSEFLVPWIARKREERRTLRRAKTDMARSAPAPIVEVAAPAAASGFNARAYLARVEAADPEQLAALLAHPTDEEVTALRARFGEARFDEMRRLALERARTSTWRRARGNVLFIPGFMGSELTRFEENGRPQALWMSIPRLVMGGTAWLRLNEDGRSIFDVRPTGVLKRSYGEMLLALSQNWNVQVFAYDWRKNLRVAAAELNDALDRLFGVDAVCHLVTHGTGGLVARTFARDFPERWRRMWDTTSSLPGRHGGRLVMLGAPNHGWFVAAEILAGRNETVRKLASLDLKHNNRELTEIFASFPALYQFLPSPARFPGATRLFSASAYPELSLPQRYFDDARQDQESLLRTIDAQRMVCINGDGLPTLCGFEPASGGQTLTPAGDGMVLHQSATLDGVRTWFVPCAHGELAANAAVLGALDELLETGQTDRLATTTAFPAANEVTARPVPAQQDSVDPALLAGHAQRVQAAGSGDAITDDERAAEDLLLRSEDRGEPASSAARPSQPPLRMFPVAVATGSIEALAGGSITALPPIGLIVVGHYRGLPPISAARDLDSLPQLENRLDQLDAAGLLPSEPGRIFLIPGATPTGPHIAVVGLGERGATGRVELSAAARATWHTAAALRLPHVATVAAGLSTGCLSAAESARAWMEAALEVGIENISPQLTFVERDPGRAERLADAVSGGSEQLRSSYDAEVHLQRLTLPAWTAPSRAISKTRPIPTRLRVSINNNLVTFSGVSAEGVIGERSIQIDPALIASIVKSLPSQIGVAAQRAVLQTLSQLLLPPGLNLGGEGPILLVLDDGSAAFPWEAILPAVGEAGSPQSALLMRPISRLLATERPVRGGRVARRNLRVMVIGDPMPAPGAHPGARLEAEALTQLFQSASLRLAPQHRIDVVSLIGPEAATRVEVLRRLLVERFDVIHFAGSLAPDPRRQGFAGWAFGENTVLSPADLTAVDFAGTFVFVNACPASASSSEDFSPPVTAAREFLRLGAGAYLSPAWAVDDQEARLFAERFYSAILGGNDAEPMNVGLALRAARQELFSSGRTGLWAAYIQFGDPDLLLS